MIRVCAWIAVPAAVVTVALLVLRGASRTGEADEVAKSAEVLPLESPVDSKRPIAVARRPVPHLDSAVAALSGEQADMAQQLADVSQRLARLSERGECPDGTPDDWAPAGSRDISADEGAPAGADGRESASPPSLAAQRAIDNFVAHTYEQAVRDDPPDPAWSPATERRMGQEIVRPELGSGRLMRSRCGSRYCAMKAGFATPDDRDRFLAGMMEAEPWSSWGSAFIHIDAPDDVEIELYFSRAGGRLPDVGPPPAGWVEVTL
jgi:hypothetical protein